MTETSTEELKTELRAIAGMVATMVEKTSGPNTGYALFLPVGGRLTYCSNGAREDMVKLLGEWLRKTTPTSVVDEDRDDPRGKWGRSFSSGETPRQVETRLAMEDRCASLGKKLGEKMQLTLLLFNFGDRGNLAYYTNMDSLKVREGIAAWLSSQK